MQRISINGIVAGHIPVMDRGLQYGDGLFETIACVNGELQFWQQHIQRMQAGANRLGIEFPGNEYFLQDVRQLCNNVPDNPLTVKLMLTRGQGDRGYQSPVKQKSGRIVIVTSRPASTAEPAKAGARLCLCKHTVSVNPGLAGIKHLNRLDNVIARNEWYDAYDEGLMMDIDGNIIEGTMSNVFGIRNDTLYTPVLDRCGVDGIIRNQVLNIARDEDINVKLCNISTEQLLSMDEIFITNSISGLWPVSSIEQKNYQTGKITLKLENGLQQRKTGHAKVLA